MMWSQRPHLVLQIRESRNNPKISDSKSEEKQKTKQTSFHHLTRTLQRPTCKAFHGCALLQKQPKPKKYVGCLSA